MNGATLHTVDVGGLAVCYRTRGNADGRPVLLLHGGASDATTWDFFAEALVAHGMRVIAPDLRGHGGTARSGAYPLSAFADDVLGLLDALGLDQVALVGHSLGAHAAALAAQRAPHRFTALVLEDPPAPIRGDATPPPSLPAFFLLGLGSFLRRRRFHAFAMREVIRQLRAPDPAYWDALPTITARTLVISGGPKSHVAPSDVAVVAERIPRAELATIPVGHRVHSRAPERFRDLVVPFLA